MGHGPGKPSSRKKKEQSEGGNGQLLFYWIVGTGLWLWALTALFSGSTGIGPLFSSILAEKEAKKTLQRIDTRVADLDRRTEALRTDPFELERQAREREHRLRPGEILVLPKSQGESQNR
ncbi:MAG: FtsB family cell division protein [Leptospirales bacterium]